jgi:hypothetical protein
MSELVRSLVSVAVAGRPVYISTVRERFDELSAAGSFELVVRLRAFDGNDQRFRFRLPLLADLPDDERAFVTEYLLSSLYNVISTLGGRGLAFESGHPDAQHLAEEFRRAFGIDAARLDRPGYGRAVNVSERVDEAVSPAGAPALGRFSVDVSAPASDGPEASPPAATAAGRIVELCRLATGGLQGTAICGIDIGGTDIKLALAIDGRIVRFVEYDWFPAAFRTIDEIIDPVLALARVLVLEAARIRGAASDPAALAAALAPAWEHGASAADFAAAAAAGETLVPAAFGLDAIGVCFPDVVVQDKIVGGEVYKTRGMRAALGAAYEDEFRRLSGLDVELRRLVRDGGALGIINDGPMAAFTAAVEVGAVDEGSIRDGVFAHTLGTELGTGWVTEDGVIPDIPLEIYNCVIDLGSHPERAFGPDDVRSVNNFNTLVPGTLQKYTSQSGVFRLAAKYLPEQDPDLYRDLLERGLLVETHDGLLVPTEPKDLRKPLLEYLMAAAEGDAHPAVHRIFREIGEFMAVAWLESRWLLDPAAMQRILFGRLVKRRACFELMVEGARRIAPQLELVVADDEMANTPLMQQLRDRADYTVAQFAQAIGAIHYANLRLRLAEPVGAEPVGAEPVGAEPGDHA